MSIFGKKNKSGDRTVNLTYVDGIEGYAKGTAIALSIDDDVKRLTVSVRVFKNPPVHLLFDQITGVSVVSEKEIIEKSKSVVGRAVAGGVLLGPLGAVIGGISGVGNKVLSTKKLYMVINYKSKNDEIKVLSFEIVGASLHWASFVEDLLSKIKVEAIPEYEERYL